MKTLKITIVEIETKVDGGVASDVEVSREELTLPVGPRFNRTILQFIVQGVRLLVNKWGHL